MLDLVDSRLRGNDILLAGVSIPNVGFDRSLNLSKGSQRYAIVP